MLRCLRLIPAIGLSLLAACGSDNNAETQTAAASPTTSGVELTGMDRSVRPQDDFHYFANGHWLETTAIPEQHSSYSPFVILREEAELHQKEIIQELAANHPSPGSIEQKIGDYYASFMDTDTINRAELQPLAAELDAIAGIDSKQALVSHFAHGIPQGMNVPLSLGIDQDLKQSDRYTAYLGQSGLGLPNRDYYLETDNERFQKVLLHYPDYIKTLFTLAGIDNGEAKSQSIIQLETELARHQWSAIENRNLEKIYNPSTQQQLAGLAPNVAWPGFLSDIGVGKLDEIIVTQPSYLTGLSQLVETTPLETWKAYLQLRLLSGYAPYLSQPFVNAHFDFYGRIISGKVKQKERWRRGIQATNEALGEAIGRVYVARHFPPRAKARMTELVDNLLAEFAERIDNLEWMGETTKQAAQDKLAKFRVKIGYPDKWRDYSALTIFQDNLVANIQAAQSFEYDYELNKLGAPIDRDEWHMTPQTVNAYYNPVMNEIVFPAAILQPPFFHLDADDAVNYGAIGMVIGHEISHGFDDQGSKFDGNGNMRNWWTDEDRERFKASTRKLIEQYNRYSPIEGMHIKGELTLGENIADLSGLTVAYHAYQRSLGGNPAPVMDGFTGDQRFFLGLAQAWRAKYREEALVQLITANPHSPPRYRVNGVVVNMPEFYRTYEVKPGDGHYLPPEERVKIW